MSNDEFTPTEWEVRDEYAAGNIHAEAEFDRMIAEVERAAAARALDWAAEHLSDGLRYEDILEINSWEAVTVCAGIVRARAAEIRGAKSDAARQEAGA